jgi:putative MATE family efflux protein
MQTLADQPYHLNRTILRLALPATGAALLRGLFTITDAWWCGRVGATALAAFGTASFWVWALVAMSLAASVGIGARVARATGAQDPLGAAQAARDGLLAAFLVASVVGTGVFVAAPWLTAAEGSDPEVAAAAAAYLRYYALGTPAIFAFDAADATLRGAGDTRTPVFIGIGSVLLNFALDPLLLFGAGPIPRLGVGGISLATAIIQTIAALVLWRIIVRRGGLAAGSARWSGAWATLRIGTPSAALSAGFSLIYVAITPAVARFGRAQLAALPIGHRSESFAYFVNVGFSSASQSLVGNRLGAKQPEHARAVAKRIALFASATTGTYSVLLVAGAPLFARFFTSDRAVVAAASAYLIIVGLSMVPQTIEMVLTGAFEGAGDTWPPLLIGIATHGARLPLVFIATRWLGGGVTSIWWVISLCSLAAGGLMTVLFVRRRWR